MTQSKCDECERSYIAKSSRQRFCSDKCRYRSKDRNRFIDCASCGEPMLRGGRHVPGKSVHMSCRGGHGSPGEYRNGCRCVECLQGNAERASAYRKKFFSENGYYPRGDWIDPLDRLSLYERDEWTCQLCHEPIDKSAVRGERLAPTLDHIMPRSLTPVPDHSPENLRTAHWSCNSSRGNRLEASL